jgi:outer membrane lipopolysaccharide assembly protein LptE/RlpB
MYRHLVNIKQYFKIIFILALVGTLYGCGFHLRGMDGTEALPPVLQKIYIDTKGSREGYSFERTLTSVLKANGAEVVNAPDQATATIKIISIALRSQPLTMTGSMSSVQYAQYYSVSYKVLDSNNNVLQDTLTISANDTYSSNASQQLSANNLIKQVIGALRERVANNIVSQLQAVKASAATILPQNDDDS